MRTGSQIIEMLFFRTCPVFCRTFGGFIDVKPGLLCGLKRDRRHQKKQYSKNSRIVFSFS